VILDRVQLTLNSLTRLAGLVVAADPESDSSLPTLYEVLCPDGPAAARLAGPAWPRLSTWEAVEAVVQAGGPGAMAFVRVGAALVLYHTADAGVRYVELSPGVPVTGAGRHGPAGDARALVVSPDGAELPIPPTPVAAAPVETGPAARAAEVGVREGSATRVTTTESAASGGAADAVDVYAAAIRAAERAVAEARHRFTDAQRAATTAEENAAVAARAVRQRDGQYASIVARSAMLARQLAELRTLQDDTRREFERAGQALRAHRTELAGLVPVRDADAERVVALTQRLPLSQARALAAQVASSAAAPAGLRSHRADASALARQLGEARQDLALRNGRVDELESLVVEGADLVAHLRAGLDLTADELLATQAAIAGSDEEGARLAADIPPLRDYLSAAQRDHRQVIDDLAAARTALGRQETILASARIRADMAARTRAAAESRAVAEAATRELAETVARIRAELDAQARAARDESPPPAPPPPVIPQPMDSRLAPPRIESLITHPEPSAPPSTGPAAPPAAAPTPSLTPDEEPAETPAVVAGPVIAPIRWEPPADTAGHPPRQRPRG
jgi:hypothetical protein